MLSTFKNKKYFFETQLLRLSEINDELESKFCTLLNVLDTLKMR